MDSSRKTGYISEDTSYLTNSEQIDNIVEEMKRNYNRKRLHVAIFIIVIITIPVACYMFLGIRTVDEYFQRHPNTEWESADPYIHVSVDEQGNTTSYMEINGKLIWIDISCLGNSRVTEICNYTNTLGHITEDDRYLRGKAKFRYDRIVIDIYKDNVFNGKYPEIILYRVE